MHWLIGGWNKYWPWKMKCVIPSFILTVVDLLSFHRPKIETKYKYGRQEDYILLKTKIIKKLCVAPSIVIDHDLLTL